MFHHNKRTRTMGNLAYIFGAAFVVVSILMNLIPQQVVIAGNENGNSGAIWTTLDDCGDETQDANHYSVGDHVFINGGNFDPNTEYSWEINGQPGGASGDPNMVVASGTLTTDENGNFCFDAYTIPSDDWGEYKVNVGNKGDNYRVDRADLASASVAIGICTWDEEVGSSTPVTITVSHASLTLTNDDTSTVVGTYTSSTIVDLPPGNYSYTWTAAQGYQGSGSGEFTVLNCTPGRGSAGIQLEPCTWDEETGATSSVTITVSNSSLTLTNDDTSAVVGTYTASTVVDLPPGNYSYTWTAAQGYQGSGSGEFTVLDCTPGRGSAGIQLEPCTWDEEVGSSSSLSITVTNASLTLTNDDTSTVVGTYTASTTLELAPGNYSYTWTASQGYQGSGSGEFTVLDCTPGRGSAEVQVGICSWDEEVGASTPVTITLSNASLTLTNEDTSTVVGTYTASSMPSLTPGNYSYTWTAAQGYQGSGSGSFVVGDCTPGDANAEVLVGICTWDQETGSSTSVSIDVSNAELTIGGLTYAADAVINLPPGTYDYTWTAVQGYQGSGDGTIVIGDCTPGNASASISTRICTWTEEDGSLTPVSISLSHALLTINGVVYSLSTTIHLPPGTYPYTWEAKPGYLGSGAGILTIGDCTPPPVPSLQISCYSLEFQSFKVFITNSGPPGVIGYRTDLDAGITSLGLLANGESVQVLIPLGATTIFVYPAVPNGWGTPIQAALSTLTTGICEDPLELTSFCSYVDLALPHGWIVTNLNDFPVEFTWSYGPEGSAAPIFLAAGATYTFTTAAHPGAVMEVFVDGILLASGSPGICPEFVALELDGICLGVTATEHGWEATNLNPFAVEAEWRVNGSLLTGLLSIPANSSVFFSTPKSEGNIAQLYYGGLLQDDAGAAVSCVEEEIPPQPQGQGGGGESVTIPVAAETPVLIPVTGVADDLAGLAPVGMFSFGLGFLGLGTILHGVSRRRLDEK